MALSRRNYCVGSLVATFVMLQGCGDPKGLACPEKGDEFFTQSINAYLRDHGKSSEVDKFVYTGGARFDDQTNWWIVPFALGGKRYQTLLSCDGNLQLSIVN